MMGIFTQGRGKTTAYAVAEEIKRNHAGTESDNAAVQIGAVELLKTIRQLVEIEEAIRAENWKAYRIAYDLLEDYSLHDHNELSDIGRDIRQAHGRLSEEVAPLGVAVSRLAKIISKEEQDASRPWSVFDEPDPFEDELA